MLDFDVKCAVGCHGLSTFHQKPISLISCHRGQISPTKDFIDGKYHRWYSIPHKTNKTAVVLIRFINFKQYGKFTDAVYKVQND
jgi:hypothetical protein